jgi:hypothetical protein
MSEPTGPILELSTLPHRHPVVGAALLERCGPACVLRLGIDPAQQPEGTLKRDVTIDHASAKTENTPVQKLRTIGWSELPHLTVDFCHRWSMAFNRNDITEDAAIAVMGLLIHALEGMTLERVSEIGSGCDYYARAAPNAKRVPLEVSGICEETSPGQARTRLKEKCDQLLGRNRAGYVSVTTFQHADGNLLHSFLHYVVKAKAKPRKGRTNKAKRRKKP